MERTREIEMTPNFTSLAEYRCLQDLHRESIELGLVYCGWEKCSPSHRFGPNRRKNNVIHVVQSGKGTLELGNKTFALSKGDAFLLYEGTEAWYEADRDDPWCYIWVGFNGLKAEECLAYSGFTREKPVCHLEDECVAELNTCMDEMLKAHQLTFSNELKRNAMLMLFLSRMIQEYQTKSPQFAERHSYPGAVYVKYAMEYIAYNYDKKIKINELADYIGVNRSYLTSSFKKANGCSPQEYLLNLRMEKARSLLKKTDMQISAVANAVGYADQLAFSKIFKKRYGISPRAYREEKEELKVKDRKIENSSLIL